MNKGSNAGAAVDAITQLTKQTSSLNAIEDAAMPKAYRTVFELERSVTGLAALVEASPLRQLEDSITKLAGSASWGDGFTQADAATRIAEQLVGSHNGAIYRASNAFSAATALHSKLEDAFQLQSGHSAWMSMQQSVDELCRGGAAWSAVTDAARIADGAGAVGRQLNRLSAFEEALKGVLPLDVHDAWSNHLKAMACPALTALAQDWPAPMGFITGLADPTLGASVSWLMSYRDEPLVMTAALTPDAEDAETDLLVDGDHACAVCGGAFLELGEAVRWDGPKRGTRHRLFFAVCLTCLRSEVEEPGFLLARLEEVMQLTRPGLRVMEGEAKDDGVRQGCLRLVKADDVPTSDA